MKQISCRFLAKKWPTGIRQPSLRRLGTTPHRERPRPSLPAPERRVQCAPNKARNASNLPAEFNFSEQQTLNPTVGIWQQSKATLPRRRRLAGQSRPIAGSSRQGALSRAGLHPDGVMLFSYSSLLGRAASDANDPDRPSIERLATRFAAEKRSDNRRLRALCSALTRTLGLRILPS
jgi:hypothetical protein